MSILIKRLHYLPSQKPGRVAPLDVGTQCTLGNGSKVSELLQDIPMCNQSPGTHTAKYQITTPKNTQWLMSPDAAHKHFHLLSAGRWTIPEFWMRRKSFPLKLFIWPAVLSGSWRRHRPAHRVWCPLRAPRTGFGPRSAAVEPTPHCGPGPPLWTSQTAAPADPEEACRGSQREENGSDEGTESRVKKTTRNQWRFKKQTF